MCQGAAMSRTINKPREGSQPLPGARDKKLTGDGKIETGGADGKHDTDQALQQQDQCQGTPPSLLPIVLDDVPPRPVHASSPTRPGDREREQRIGQQNAGKEKEAEASGHAKPGVEAGAFSECPDAESRGRQAKGNCRQGYQGCAQPSQ